MDWRAVASGLATAARAVEGLNTHNHVPLSVTVPAFVVARIEGTIEGYCAEQLQVTCAVLVGKVEDAAAAGGLYQYAQPTGDRSLLQALEQDRTLGGVCKDVTVTTRRIPDLMTIGTTEYLAAELIVQVDGEV